MSVSFKAALLLLALAPLGCGQALRQPAGILAEQEALALAVSLANDACQTRYQRAPFAADTYAIMFEEGRWHWGRLDPAGPRGYSATVSFDAQGGERAVEVYFSSDVMEGMY